MKETVEPKKTKTTKKKNIIILISLIVLFIVIIFVVIYSSKETLLSGKKASKLVTAVANEKYYIKLMKVDSNMKETGEEVELTKRGDDIVLVLSGYSIIIDGDNSYFVSKEEKMVIKGEKDSLKGLTTEPTLITDTTSIDNPEILSEKIDGKEYYVEKYNDLIMYFDSNDNISYIKNGEEAIKVLDFDNNVKTDLFKIPSDYKILTEEEFNDYLNEQ